MHHPTQLSFAAFLLFALPAPLASPGAGSGAAGQESQRIDAEQCEAIVFSLADLIEENYIFAEEAARHGRLRQPHAARGPGRSPDP